MLNYTQKEALENINHFEHKEAMGGLATIASGVMLALLFTDAKAQGEAVSTIFDTSNSNAAQYRRAALRLAYYHGAILKEIADGEKSLGSATNAIAEHIKQFMGLGVNGKPVIWANKDAYNAGEALALLPLMPNDEAKKQEKHAIKQALRAQANSVDKTIATVPLSNTSENSEKGSKTKEPNQPKTALQVMMEGIALVMRSVAMEDATSIEAHRFFAKFLDETQSSNGAIVSAEIRYMQQAYSIGKEYNNKRKNAA